MPSRRRSRSSQRDGAGSVTTHSYRGYLFTISCRLKDPWYTVDFPDIPEIITSGPTLARAFANACEALDLYLESLHEVGKRPPMARHRLRVQSV